MAFTLFPKTVKFYDLFIKQNQKLIQSAIILSDIFENYSNVEEKCAQIHVIEEDADLISREITRQLSQTFITPIDREDIHGINIAQEEVQNSIDRIATRVGIYGFTSIQQTAKLMMTNIKLMIEETGKMVVDLSHKQDIIESYNVIRQLKDDCETFIFIAFSDLYNYRLSSPDECMDIIDIVKWTHIYNRIEECVYRTGRLANIIEGITLKNA